MWEGMFTGMMVGIFTTMIPINIAMVFGCFMGSLIGMLPGLANYCSCLDDSGGTIARSSLLGFFIGVLPGADALHGFRVIGTMESAASH